MIPPTTSNLGVIPEVTVTDVVPIPTGTEVYTVLELTVNLSVLLVLIMKLSLPEKPILVLPSPLWYI